MVYSKEGYNKMPMWQWVVIYLAIGGVVYAAIYYAFYKPKGGYIAPTAYPTVTPPVTKGAPTGVATPVLTSYVVYAKSTGFEPQAITIKTGQTVTWTNQSGTNVFVASSPHPSHTDYLPLNLGIIKNGDSKSLSFPTPGTYKYHNHLNAGQYGSITVQ